MKAHLAAFKAPKQVIAVATVGRAANGKLDYGRLREQAADTGGAAGTGAVPKTGGAAEPSAVPAPAVEGRREPGGLV